LDGGGGCVQAQRFAGVELQEVDGLADVRVCLSPVLADFAGEPRAEFEFAQADEAGSAKEQGSAFLHRLAAPGRECRLRDLHRRFHVALIGALVDADHFRGAGWVDGDDLRVGLASRLPPMHEVVLVAQASPGPQPAPPAWSASIGRVGEIQKGLIDERSFVGAQLALRQVRGIGGSRHSPPF
jgi:hypothetical protein